MELYRRSGYIFILRNKTNIFEVIIILPIFVCQKERYAHYIYFVWFQIYVLCHIHIHVVKGNICAKFTLFPKVELVENKGLKPSELKLVESVIEENKEIIAEHWNKFFNRSI